MSVAETPLPLPPAPVEKFRSALLADLAQPEKLVEPITGLCQLIVDLGGKGEVAATACEVSAVPDRTTCVHSYVYTPTPTPTRPLVP